MKMVLWHWRNASWNIRVLVFVTTFAYFVSPLLTLASARALQYMIDSAVNGLSEPFIWAVVAQALIFACLSVVDYVQAVGSGVVASRYANILRKRVYGSMMAAQLDQIRSRESGTLITRVLDDIDQVSNGLMSLVPGFLRSIVMTIGSVVFLFVVNWKLALLSLAITPLIAVCARIYGGRFEQVTRTAASAKDSLTTWVGSTLRQLEFAKSVCAIPQCADRFGLLSDDLDDAQKTRVALQAKASAVSRTLGASVFAVAFVFGGYLVLRAELTVGALVAFANVLNNVTWPFTSMSMDYSRMRGLGSIHRRIVEMVDLPLEEEVQTLQHHSYSSDYSDGDSAVVLEGVHFAYGNNVVLQGLSLKTVCGESIALVGANGSGKSTLLRLLLGLYPVDEGEILVLGRPVSSYSKAQLRSLFAYVPQSYSLLPMSVCDNLLLGNTGVSCHDLEYILSSLGFSNANEILSSLKGEDGREFSGGELRRIAIARAIAGAKNRARIALLDEWSTNLDMESEARALDLLESTFDTVITVTHRLDIARRCNRIVVLEEGRCVECGTYDELMSNRSYFWNYVQRGLLKEEVTDAGLRASRYNG